MAMELPRGKDLREVIAARNPEDPRREPAHHGAGGGRPRLRPLEGGGAPRPEAREHPHPAERPGQDRGFRPRAPGWLRHDADRGRAGHPELHVPRAGARRQGGRTHRRVLRGGRVLRAPHGPEALRRGDHPRRAVPGGAQGAHGPTQVGAGRPRHPGGGGGPLPHQGQEPRASRTGASSGPPWAWCARRWTRGGRTRPPWPRSRSARTRRRGRTARREASPPRPPGRPGWKATWPWSPPRTARSQPPRARADPLGRAPTHPGVRRTTPARRGLLPIVGGSIVLALLAAGGYWAWTAEQRPHRPRPGGRRARSRRLTRPHARGGGSLDPGPRRLAARARAQEPRGQELGRSDRPGRTRPRSAARKRTREADPGAGDAAAAESWTPRPPRRDGPSRRATCRMPRVPSTACSSSTPSIRW